MTEVKDHHYFNEQNPMSLRCDNTETHPEHKHSKVEQPFHGDPTTVRTWYACPGFELTHTITVTDADNRVIGERRLDLRKVLEYNGSTNDPLLTLLYEAKEAGLPRPSDDEMLFAIAGLQIAPEVCPWDSDRCHEHLYEIANELEGEEE